MDSLLAHIEATPLADTHEHLLEEKSRLVPGEQYLLHDIGLLFSVYGRDDLVSAGMHPRDVHEALTLATDPEEKWRLLSPFWPRIATSGYGQVISESIRMLYGIDRLDDSTWRDVNDAVGRLIQPGFQRRVLRDVANVDHCQVHTFEDVIFCESDDPDLLLQDIVFNPLSSDPDLEVLPARAGIEVRTLDDFLEVVDWAFATHAPRAVAMKNNDAYKRRLDYEPVALEDARREFARWLAEGATWDRPRRKPIEDFLFTHCMGKAAEHDLPVKLHTGYYAGVGHMDLGRVGSNPADMSRLCMLHPRTRFVFMHITYPRQDEAIAVAKHFANATVDMCWAWTVNPSASVRFLKEMLMGAPSNKVLTFGGDYVIAELVPGHAALARRGIHQALVELRAEGWLRGVELEALATQLMIGNCREMFDVERARQACAATP